MQARAAQQVAADPIELGPGGAAPPLPIVDAAPASPAAARRAATARSRSRPTRPVSLPRPVEYAFIRNDMRRLLAIAALLLVLMLALEPLLSR